MKLTAGMLLQLTGILVELGTSIRSICGKKNGETVDYLCNADEIEVTIIKNGVTMYFSWDKDGTKWIETV